MRKTKARRARQQVVLLRLLAVTCLAKRRRKGQLMARLVA